MKTDPENADYTVEKGATRNYEPWREKDKDKAVAAAQREDEERGNAMKVRDCTSRKLALVGRCSRLAVPHSLPS